MNELEQQLLQTFKNFVARYEQDKRQQEEQLANLVQQVYALSDSVTKLNERVEQLAQAYQDITNVLEE